MNRIFLTGKAGEVRIFFTPRGERIALFLLRVDDLDIIEVMYLDSEGKLKEEDISGKTLMVAGTLARPEKEWKFLRVKAKNIALMED